jgi:hypothetical protein
VPGIYRLNVTDQLFGEQHSMLYPENSAISGLNSRWLTQSSFVSIGHRTDDFGAAAIPSAF